MNSIRPAQWNALAMVFLFLRQKPVFWKYPEYNRTNLRGAPALSVPAFAADAGLFVCVVNAQNR